MIDPKEYGARCDSCPRRARYLAREYVLPEGNVNKAICVWLGQDPGKKETRERRPFVGPTGAKIAKVWSQECLDSGLEKPIEREDIYIMNSALCQPIEKSDKEAQGAAICCRPFVTWFLVLVSRVKPKIGILAMGKWAWFALTGRETGMGKYQGFHLHLDPEIMYEEASSTADSYEKKHGPTLEDEIPF